MSNLGCCNGNCVVKDHPKGSIVTHGWCQCLRALSDEDRVHVEAKLHQLRRAEDFIKELSKLPGTEIIMAQYWEHRLPKL